MDAPWREPAHGARWLQPYWTTRALLLRRLLRRGRCGRGSGSPLGCSALEHPTKAGGFLVPGRQLLLSGRGIRHGNASQAVGKTVPSMTNPRDKLPHGWLSAPVGLTVLRGLVPEMIEAVCAPVASLNLQGRKKHCAWGGKGRRRHIHADRYHTLR